MRVVLATTLLLLAAPAFAQQGQGYQPPAGSQAWQQSQSQPGSQQWQSGSPSYQFGTPNGQSTMNPGGQQYNQSQTSNNQVLLLVPDREMSQFQQAVPQSVSHDLQAQQAQPFQFNGEQYRLIALPAQDLRKVDQATSGKSLHNDVKVVLGFGDFVNVANLSALDQMQASSGSSGQSSTSSMQQSMAGSGPGAAAGTSGTATVQQVQPTSNGKLISLQDGRTLFLPDSVSVTGGSLQPGADISGRYIQQNGQNVVTALRVH